MKKLLALLSVLSLSLVACGGGGGGSSTSSAPSVNIDSRNAETVTAVAYDAAMMIADQREFSDFLRNSSVKGDSNNASSLLGISKLGLSFLPTTQQARTTIENQSCDSGDFTITVGVNDNAFDDPGEYLDISFNNCLLDGDLLDGSLRMTIRSWTSELNFVIDNAIDLDTVVDGIATSSTGTITLGLSTSGSTTTFTLSSNSITGTVGTETSTMTNLNVTVTETSTGYTTDLSMGLSSNAIGGSVNIDTDPVLSYGQFDDYPSTGILTVTGSDGSYVSLNADTGNLTTVILTIFDGTSATSDEIPWSQLDTNY